MKEAMFSVRGTQKTAIKGTVEERTEFEHLRTEFDHPKENLINQRFDAFYLRSFLTCWKI